MTLASRAGRPESKLSGATPETVIVPVRSRASSPSIRKLSVDGSFCLARVTCRKWYYRSRAVAKDARVPGWTGGRASSQAGGATTRSRKRAKRVAATGVGLSDAARRSKEPGSREVLVAVDESPFEHPVGVELDVELGAVDRRVGEPKRLVRTELGEGELDARPRGRRVTRSWWPSCDVEALRQPREPGIATAGRVSSTAQRAELSALRIGDHFAAERLGDELVPPAGAEERPAGRGEPLDHRGERRA